jgi:hypothetical protein
MVIRQTAWQASRIASGDGSFFVGCGTPQKPTP